MTTNGSFYTNGLPISSVETGLGNLPTGAPVANKASSSFYLSGSVYQTLANQDALLAILTADTSLVASDLVASNVAAANAAASAAAASATLASSLKIASNLSDLASVPTALTNLGLNNVTNTSDINKPVSTAQATADALVASNAAAATALKANIASPVLTGVPVAPTAAALTNSTQLATTAYADAATSVLSGTLTASLALKAPLASPAITGTPTAPTATALTNSTQLATTAYADAADTAVTSTTNTALALKAPLASPALSGTPTAPTATVGTNTTQLATTAFVLANVAASGVSSIAGNTGAFTLGDGLANATNVLKVDAPSLRGYLSGLTLSTAGASATYGIAIGVAVDSTSAGFMKLTSAYTKTTSAWALGTAAGSLDTGAIAASTWYHVHLIKRTNTGVVDVLCSLSATAPTMPASYTLFRRIGSMKTNGSSQWILFHQIGDEFLWDVPVQDANNVTLTSTAASLTLTVPTGLQVWASVVFAGLPTVNVNYLITSLDTSDVLPGSTAFNAIGSASIYAGYVCNVRTNTSAQLRWRANGSATGSYMMTQGWIDTRGKLL